MPLLKTLSVGLGGIAATVAIYSSGIIGANYTSAIVDHIIDMVNGPNTSVMPAPNAPTWSIGIQMPQIQGVTATVATGGTLASSTAFTFQVAAIDVQGGTTTLSSAVTANVPLYSSTSSINIQAIHSCGSRICNLLRDWHSINCAQSVFLCNIYDREHDTIHNEHHDWITVRNIH
jgi:hypothetical protein